MDRNALLKKLKAHWIENDIPNISEDNAEFLRNILQDTKPKLLLEIWSANGYSTIHFGDELEQWWGKITSIEFSQLAYESAGDNFAEAKLEDTIKHYFWDARDIIPLLDEQYDFVFIDWLKKASLTFLKLVWDKTIPGSTIIIDDVIKFRYKMEDLYEYLETENISYELIKTDSDDGIMKIIR